MEEKQYYLSPDLAHRLAAIDVGTNSIRLVVAEALRDRDYRILTEEKDTARLGKDLATTGRLNAAAVERSLEALRRMQQIAAGYQVRELRVIGTCALREAADGPDFCQRVKQEMGLTIDVIAAEQEAHLAFSSVARAFNLDGKNVAVADIGGGSTEIILASGRVIEDVYTTPLGAVRMTDMYCGQDNGELENMVVGIDRELRRHVKRLMFWPHLLIGSGGTFTTLAEMIMAAKGQTALPLRGYEVTHAEVGHLLDKLRKLPPKARRGLPGLSPDRADIILAGVAIVDGLMRRFKVNRLQVHDRGVRDGLLLSMLDQSFGVRGDDPLNQDAAIERFATNCGVDLKHARQVARLAVQIFSQVAGEAGLTSSDGLLLHAAAVLQDVGYLIDYEKHHKHSYHLILHSRLAGFPPHQLELIANVARYHRGKEPKKKHDNFSRLGGKDQQRVRKLAAILRLAGGFDRSNTQQVREVVVSMTAHETTLRAVSSDPPEVDLWAARRRAEPFEKEFGRPTVIEWLDAKLVGANGGEPAAATTKSGAVA